MLSFVKYRESSVIARIYTERFGVQSYIENGVRSAKGKNKIALFQPLTLLDMVVYHDDKKEIHRISEMRCYHPFSSLPYEIGKSCIGLFIAEILHKTLKEHTGNSALYEFLSIHIIELDRLQEGYGNFHLHFLVRYSLYLGFLPHSAKEISGQLDEYAIPYSHDPEIHILLDQLIGEEEIPSQLSRKTRNELLDILLLFYRIHIEDFGDLKSLPVLKEILA